MVVSYDPSNYGEFEITTVREEAPTRLYSGGAAPCFQVYGKLTPWGAHIAAKDPLRSPEEAERRRLMLATRYRCHLLKRHLENCAEWPSK